MYHNYSKAEQSSRAAAAQLSPGQGRRWPRVSGVLLPAALAARGRGVLGRARAPQLRQAEPGQHLLQQVAVVAPVINPHLPQRLRQPPLRSAFLGRAGLLRLRFNTPKRSVVKLKVFLTIFKKNKKPKKTPENPIFFFFSNWENSSLFECETPY